MKLSELRKRLRKPPEKSPERFLKPCEMCLGLGVVSGRKVSRKRADGTPVFEATTEVCSR